MLEIVALIILAKKNGDLAELKGLKPLSWKLLTVAAWIISEVLFIVLIGVLGFNLMENIILLAITGLAGGFCGYLLVRQVIMSKPAVNNEIDSLAEHLEE